MRFPHSSDDTLRWLVFHATLPSTVSVVVCKGRKAIVQPHCPACKLPCRANFIREPQRILCRAVSSHALQQLADENLTILQAVGQHLLETYNKYLTSLFSPPIGWPSFSFPCPFRCRLNRKLHVLTDRTAVIDALKKVAEKKNQVCDGYPLNSISLPGNLTRELSWAGLHPPDLTHAPAAMRDGPELRKSSTFLSAADVDEGKNLPVNYTHFTLTNVHEWLDRNPQDRPRTQAKLRNALAPLCSHIIRINPVRAALSIPFAPLALISFLRSFPGIV